MSKLAVVVPVYNTDLVKLRRCLSSIPDDKHIIVRIYDDCSTSYDLAEELKIMSDETPLLSYVNSDRCKLVKMKTNMGLGFVRNTSVKDLYDSGYKDDYVVFLDSDDELDLINHYDKIQYLLDNRNYNVLSYGIDLICDGVVSKENSEKFISQMMIPYLITPNIYKIKFLVDNSIVFDESRRTFEDIPFSVKLWSLIIAEDLEVLYSDKTIYKYYLEGESLTRNDKKKKLMEDLKYWVEWIRIYFSHINSPCNANKLRGFLFNRIRYEEVKILTMRMELDGTLPRYKKYLNYLKPYNIDNILSTNFD
jgi:hypothetical protein